MSGGELFERIIDEDFELTERECIKYMRQISEGVEYIHKQGIVHLDLKPENIMCVNKTGTRIKLIDFGLARRLGKAHPPTRGSPEGSGSGCGSWCSRHWVLEGRHWVGSEIGECGDGPGHSPKVGTSLSNALSVKWDNSRTHPIEWLGEQMSWYWWRDESRALHTASTVYVVLAFFPFLFLLVPSAAKHFSDGASSPLPPACHALCRESASACFLSSGSHSSPVEVGRPDFRSLNMQTRKPRFTVALPSKSHHDSA